MERCRCRTCRLRARISAAVGPLGLVLVGAGLVLGSCAAPIPGSSPTRSAAAGDGTSGAHQAFVERTPLASCGEVGLGQGESVPEDAWQCLDDAFGTGAELVVTRPTDEGDPIVSYYRVGPGGLEIFHDATADRFGTQVWTRTVCPDAVSVRETVLQGCS